MPHTRPDSPPWTREAACRACPLRRTCITVCRYVEALLPSMEEGRVDAEDLARLHEGRLMVHALLDHLDRLSPRQRDVVTLYYCENLQQQEIAHILLITQQAVADILQRARHAVARHLRSRFRSL